MMISAGADERGGVAHFQRHFETEHAAVEPQRAIQIRHLEMDVADAGGGVDGGRRNRHLLLQVKSSGY